MDIDFPLPKGDISDHTNEGRYLNKIKSYDGEIFHTPLTDLEVYSLKTKIKKLFNVDVDQ